MRNLKKIAALALAFATTLGAGIIAACSKENTSGSLSASESPAPSEYMYKIRVQSEGGFGLRGVSVTLKNADGAIVSSKTTSSDGDAYFTKSDVPTAATYDVSISGLREGWNCNTSVKYQTGAEGSDLVIPCTPQMLMEEAAQSTRYRLGDVMHDFTVTTSDNKQFILSQILEEKEMVLLNFFYDGCGPCATEFPVMQNAYMESLDNVEILAVSTRDNQAQVASYKERMGLTFPMAGSNDLSTFFGVSAVPVSVVIDRYGVISYWHLGSMTAKSDFIGLFDKFTGENYVQTVIGEDEYTGSGNTGNEEEEKVKPNVSAPTASNVLPVLAQNNVVVADSFQWDEDEYSWPFTIETDENGVKYLRASNANIHNSYALMHFDVEAQANSALVFDLWLSTEADADLVYVYVDGNPIQKLSGIVDQWQTQLAYVFENGQAGKHSISLCYLKDTADNGGEDEVWVKNFRFIDADDLSDVDDLATAYVLRQAATNFNAPVANAAQKKNKFNNYIDWVYNETDGFYHVKTKDGPLLFAYLLGAAPNWNMFDLWQLAYNKYLVVDGIDLQPNVEYYAATATNAYVDYVPVTPQLHKLLDLIVSVDTYGEEKEEQYRKDIYYDPAYHVSYHENEWLELCLYFDNYASTPAMPDPARGVSFDSAIEVFEGENKIVCDKSLVPVGIKHKFIPKVSGVYRFYSTVAAELQGTSANTDPQAWIIASDKKTELAYNDDFLLNANNNNQDNFNIYYYCEAGETYYLSLAFFLNATGEFTMQIDRITENAPYTYLTNCAEGMYSFNLVTNETYVPGAIAYTLGKDGVYHVLEKDANGNETTGGKLYLDMINATYLFPNDSLENVLSQADKYAENKRLFYLDGKDYTAVMRQYLHKAKLNDGAYYGLVEIDEQLLEILLSLTKKADGFGGVKNSWQYACYYEKTAYATDKTE
ncbi:MAG: redoxin domain-containing protein [Clostridia bacterium]|nr:redoxin domain-containing protein [Clostridia bacterium]